MKMATIQNPARPRKPRILIVTPAMASANNGNWRTASRWQRFLRPVAAVRCVPAYDGESCDLMIALHARRSAASIAAFSDTGRPCIVVLTGTDLYRDIRTDAQAQGSLQRADRLVLLQPAGLRELAPALHDRCRVIEQSAPALTALPPRRRVFDLALVGHLRDEKDPMTAVRALSALGSPRLRLRHVGRTDDPVLGPAMAAAAQADPRIELLGPRSHARTRQLIRRSRLLLLPSRMEGGANVLIEAVTCDVPVLASRIGGSLGLLGEDYAGYFETGDAGALATLIDRCEREPGFLEHLRDACRARAPLFEPAREAAALQGVVRELLPSLPAAG